MNAKEIRDELASQMKGIDLIVEWARERQSTYGASQIELEQKSFMTETEFGLLQVRDYLKQAIDVIERSALFGTDQSGVDNK